MRIIRFLTVVLFFVAPAYAHAAGLVVASIKPLHSLVAGVMEGDGNTLTLLVDGTASPHEFSLKPSQMIALQHADAVFYMGDNFELFMRKILTTLPDTTKRVSMQNIPNLTLYPARLGMSEHSDLMDLHLWMDPANAKRMVAVIAEQLSAAYPNNAALYKANAAKLGAKIDALNDNLKQRMKPLAGKPYIVFHDAFQYFEKIYGLNDAGAITYNPEHALGARHVQEIRDVVQAQHIRCVFYEPSFDHAVIANILEGMDAKSDVLDPEGALLTPSPALYFQLMNGVAGALENCLSS